MQGVRASQGKAFRLPDTGWMHNAAAFIDDQLSMQRSEAFLWSPVFIAVGILIYFSLSFEPPVWLASGLVIVTGAVACLTPPESFQRLSAMGILLITLGFAAGTLRTVTVHTPVLDKEIKFADVKGHIARVEKLEGEKSYRVIIRNPAIEKLASEDTPRNVRIKLRSDVMPRPGDYVEVLAGLNPPSTPVIPGGFDFRRYMYFQGVGAVGFSYGAPKALREGGRVSAFEVFEGLRNGVAARISEQDERYGAVAAALLVGHRGAIHEEDNEALRAAGLAHMLAISGLHIGLFFGVVFFVVRFALAAAPNLALNYPIKNYAAMAAITAAGFYMILAGATIPTQRAMMMMALVFLAILLNRTPFSMRLVAFAAIVVLLTAPESLLSPSFQMSFAAVAALVAFYQAIKPYWSAWYAQAGWMRKTALYVLGVMMTTIVASFATAPFALYHFHQFAVLGVVANVLAMPVLALIVMPCAVLYFLLLPLGLEGAVASVMLSGIEFILATAHFVASSDWAVVQFKAWPGVYLALYGAGFVILLLVAGKMRYLCLPLFICLLCLISIAPKPDIIISDDAALISLRNQRGGYMFSTLRKNKFVREQWQEALALPHEKVLRWSEGEGLACDERACRIEIKGKKVSVVYTPEVQQQECLWADIMISSKPLSYCESARVIDRFDVYARGAASVFLHDGVDIRYATDPEKKRPWMLLR